MKKLRRELIKDLDHQNSLKNLARLLIIQSNHLRQITAFEFKHIQRYFKLVKKIKITELVHSLAGKVIVVLFGPFLRKEILAVESREGLVRCWDSSLMKMRIKV